MHPVTYVGDNGSEHQAILFGPADSAVADRLLVFDNDTGAPRWEHDVPRRAPGAEEGNGHTFH